MLKELVVEEIRKKGFVTFDRFVELCLYHPEYGYYTSKRLGNFPGEDFVTAVELTPAFGKTLASYMVKKSKELELPLNVLELGGGKGFLAKDVTDFADVQSYTVLEVREKPAYLKGVNWIKDLSEIGEFSGFILANEFFDAFPFKRVRKINGNYFEVVVKEKGGKLFEDVVTFTGKLPRELEEGEEYPFFVGWEKFIEKLSKVLKKAYFLIFDYGGERTPFQFKAFRKNRLVEDYLDNLGKTDLTASVDFSYLKSLLKNFGFSVISLKPQSSFLLENGIEKFLKPDDVFGALSLFVDMGRKFRVLEASFI
jgi:NADH dehydrogenase [ubiquinone] 1 alpha subcomplex assembly factor 7